MHKMKGATKVGALGIIGNLFLLIIKFIVAFLSGSKSLIADATNSAGDILSSIMTYIGGAISSRPSDEDHNFGHAKAEYIYSLLISIFMIFIASKILYDSIKSIIVKDEFSFSIYLIIVCIITILTKLGLYLYSKKVYQNHPNILIKACMKDHKNDMFVTTGTLISVVLGYFNVFIFDGIIGSITSIYIIYSAVTLFLESYKVLMDVSLDNEQTEEIIEFIKSNPDVVNVHEFKTVATGNKFIAILTIDVDGNISTFTSHKIADDLEEAIETKFRKIYKVTIHVNPIDVNKM